MYIFGGGWVSFGVGGKEGRVLHGFCFTGLFDQGGGQMRDLHPFQGPLVKIGNSLTGPFLFNLSVAFNEVLEGW